MVSLFGYSHFFCMQNLQFCSPDNSLLQCMDMIQDVCYFTWQLILMLNQNVTNNNSSIPTCKQYMKWNSGCNNLVLTSTNYIIYGLFETFVLYIVERFAFLWPVRFWGSFYWWSSLYMMSLMLVVFTDWIRSILRLKTIRFVLC